MPSSAALHCTNSRTECCSGCNHKIFRLVLLENQPLQTNIISGMAPVTQCVHVAEIEAVLQALGNIWLVHA